MPGRKDAEREEARRLRREGLAVPVIAERLGVAKSSVSVWVRDIPGPPRPERRPRRLGRPMTPPPTEPPPPGAPTRHCSRCDQDLPLTAFNRAGEGHQHWCRECFRDYFRERGDKHRRQSRAAARRRREAGREVVREHLREHPCVDCGEDEIYVLEFDHHTGKKVDTIARLLASAASLPRVRAELERCEVVCVNCHRRRTASRAGQYRATGVAPPSWDGLRRRNQEYVVATLRRSACVDCGERDPVVLDFDHRGEKRENVSRLVHWRGLDAIKAEIALCDVRCANCHRLRTLRSGCWRESDHWAAELYRGSDRASPENPDEH